MDIREALKFSEPGRTVF